VLITKFNINEPVDPWEDRMLELDRERKENERN